MLVEMKSPSTNDPVKDVAMSMGDDFLPTYFLYRKRTFGTMNKYDEVCKKS
jgi:hypothetical protein